MNKCVLAVLSALLIVAPIAPDARQVVKHHVAKAQRAQPSPQAANPNCALGGTPPAGTQCGISDLTLRPGGTLQDTDTMRICPNASGCFGTSTTYQDAQAPLGSYWTPYFRSKVFSSTLAGTVPASGGGTTNFLRADGTWGAPGGAGGGTVTSVTAGTGLGATPSNPITGSGTVNCSIAGSGTTGCVTPPGGTTTFLRADGTWATATGGTGSPTTVWTGTVTGTNAYTATAGSGQSTFANAAGNMFCGNFPNASTNAAAVTLAVSPATALPVHVQYGNSTASLAGAGDIPGGVNFCLQIDPTNTFWVKKDLVPGGVLRDAAANGHTVTAFEWSTGYTYVFTSAVSSPNLILPSVATGLSPNGGITVAFGTAGTITPNAADGINGHTVGTALGISGGVYLVTTAGTGGTTTSVTAQGGQPEAYPFTWGPNMNLQAVPLELVSRGVQTQAAVITCTVSGAAPATATVDLYAQADGSAPTGSGSIKLTSTTSCNAAGTLYTQQNLPAGTTIPGGYHIWVVGACGASACTGTNGWLGTLTGTAGKIQLTLVP